MTDFLPTATLVNLRRRAQLLERLRRYFHEQGFWEVETPVLSHDTVIDRYLDPIPVVAPCPSFPSRGSLESAPCWLQTSPEFGMKRLLAAGADAIYQVTRAFRRDENGPLHNPEFTMVEWYRVGHTMKEAIELLGKLCDSLLPFGIPECRSYCEVFEQHLGIQPHRATLDELIAAANRATISIPESLVRDSIAGTRLHANLRDEWLNLLLAEAIQPHLGITRPTIVYHYPASQAALARIVEEYDRVAERFELYVHGIELANGYHELLDPAVLAERQALANRQRQADGKAVLPENNRLLGAMQHGLPACAGTALGFDRLVMVALGAKRIDEVIAFPFDRA